MKSDDRFKIFVERLRDGHRLEVNELYDTDFLSEGDSSLAFKGPLKVLGDIYLAGDELVLHLSLAVVALIPCIICNSPVEVDITLPEIYEVIPLDDISHGIFDMQGILRENILIECQPYVECGGGSCPHRGEVSGYFKKGS